MTTTRNDIFDAVKERFADGAGRAYSEPDGCCLYQMPDGNRCAVGALLTPQELDAILSADANNEDLSELYHSDLLPERLRPHVNLLKELQLIHDHKPNWSPEGEFTAWDDLDDLLHRALIGELD